MDSTDVIRQFLRSFVASRSICLHDMDFYMHAASECDLHVHGRRWCPITDNARTLYERYRRMNRLIVILSDVMLGWLAKTRCNTT